MIRVTREAKKHRPAWGSQCRVTDNREEKLLLTCAEGKFMLEEATLVRSDWSGRQVWSWESHSHFKSSQVSRAQMKHIRRQSTDTCHR